VFQLGNQRPRCLSAVLCAAALLWADNTAAAVERQPENPARYIKFRFSPTFMFALQSLVGADHNRQHGPVVANIVHDI